MHFNIENVCFILTYVAYCGLFSSGIGFMFPILEGLSDGAVNMGIPRDLSLQIAAQTMKGIPNNTSCWML